MQADTTLAPCPFCGSSNVSQKSVAKFPRIQCQKCWASSPLCLFGDTAVDAWNRRAQAPALKLAAAQQPPAALPGEQDARTAFIRWHMGYLHTDEMLAAHVWDQEHLVSQSWRAAMAVAKGRTEGGRDA